MGLRAGSNHCRSFPPRRVEFALEMLGLSKLRVLDVGCGSGEHLLHFPSGSLGLDLSESELDQARRAGLTVRRWNFTDPIPKDLEAKFEAIWCSNFLEHVLDPHPFLLRLRSALVDGGLLVVTVPQTGLISVGPWRGYRAADHVNFFNHRTLRSTIEYAGYEVRFVGAGLSPKLPLWAATAIGWIAPTVLAVGTPIPGFQYSKKAHKVLNGNDIVFVDE